jgi:phosphoglycerate dehydrogenase-like enzyme
MAPLDSQSDQLAAIREADFLLSSEVQVDAEMLQAAEKLRLIMEYQVGPRVVDLKAAQEHQIPVVRIPCLALYTVAEFAVMSMLALAKEYVKACSDTEKKVWLPDLQPSLTTQTQYAYNWVNLIKFDTIFGKTAGVVGLGTIGRAVAELLRPFHVEVLYTDVVRISEVEEGQLGVQYVELEQLLRRADFVTLHLRLNEETENFMGEQEFSMMKPSAYFINTSRGRVVDEEALYRALSNGRIAGAALDVFWVEPLPEDNPLWQLDNVIITPHVAGIPVGRAVRREVELIARHLAKYSDGVKF